MKKIVGVAAACLLSALMCVPAMAVTRGKIVDSSTYVPLRGAFKELNFKINWDNEARKAYLDDGVHKLVVPVDKDFVTVDGKEFTLEKPVKNFNGSIYLPLRALTELINADIDWDGENKLVSIEYNGYSSFVLCDEASFIGDFGTYDEFPNVPNFGVIPGTELVNKSVGDKTASYTYYVDQQGIKNTDDPEGFLERLFTYIGLIEVYNFEDNGSTADKAVYLNSKLNQTLTMVGNEDTSKITLTVTQN